MLYDFTAVKETTKAIINDFEAGLIHTGNGEDFAYKYPRAAEFSIDKTFEGKKMYKLYKGKLWVELTANGIYRISYIIGLDGSLNYTDGMYCCELDENQFGMLKSRVENMIIAR